MNQPTQSMHLEQDLLYALAGADGVLYAARTSGLYRSRDGGAHWENTFASLDMAETPAAVAVAAHGSTVFAGVNGAVLRSDDAGGSWTVFALASPPPLVVALVLSPQFDVDGVVLAGTAEDGVFVSSDRGATWVPWNFGLIDKSVFALALSPDFARDQTVVAGTSSGVFASYNGGRGWHDLPFPEEAAPALCLAFLPDGTLLAGTEDHGLYASPDRGKSWQRFAPDVFPGGIQAIECVSLPTAALVVLLENEILISSDNSRTWRKRDLVLPPDRVATAVTPGVGSPNSLYVGLVDGEIVGVAL